VLAYDRPLATYGLRVDEGRLVLASRGSEGVPLPPPAHWLTGQS